MTKILPTIYFDMDGVLAKWNSKASVEDTFEKGYFLHCEPDYKMIDLAKTCFSAFPKQTYILSAAYQNGYAEKEKRVWLESKGLGGLQKIFVPYGNRKEDYAKTNRPAILIDDFSQNLRYWNDVPQHFGIKYYNGINGTKYTWTGPSLSRDMTVDEMIEKILEVSFELEEEAD